MCENMHVRLTPADSLAVHGCVLFNERDTCVGGGGDTVTG